MSAPLPALPPPRRSRGESMTVGQALERAEEVVGEEHDEDRAGRQDDAVDGSGGRARDGDAQAEQGEPRGVDAENRAGHEGEQRRQPEDAIHAHRRIEQGRGDHRQGEHETNR